MSILFLVLKIIGWILLSLLILILAILLLILFVPIRYNLRVNKELEEAKFNVSVKITYLLHIVRFCLNYYEKLEYYLKVLFFKVYPRNKSIKKKTKNEKRTSNKSEINSSNSDTNPDNMVDNTENVEFTNTEGVDYTFERNDDDINKNELSNIDTSSDNTDSPNEECEEKKSFIDRIISIIKKVIDFIFGIPEKIEKIQSKVIDIKENIDYYINAINDENNRNAVLLCLNSLLKILKSIRPRKIKGYIHIGKEDPYELGKILTIYSMLYPLTHDKIVLESEFDKELLECDLLVKGKITVIVLLIVAVKIYFNKNVRNLIKVMKR